MAQQLCAQGQIVGLLALFDTWSPGYLKLLALPLNHRVSRHADALAHLGFRERVAYISNRAKARLDPAKWIKEYLARTRQKMMRTACRVYLGLGRPLPRALLGFYVGETLHRARENYVPKPYPGRVTFFQATDHSPRYYHDPWLDRESLVTAGFTSGNDVEAVWNKVHSMGWGALAKGGLEIIPIPGKHADCVREPYVKHLAEKLSACIDRSLKANPSTVQATCNPQ